MRPHNPTRPSPPLTLTLTLTLTVTTTTAHGTPTTYSRRGTSHHPSWGACASDANAPTVGPCPPLASGTAVAARAQVRGARFGAPIAVHMHMCACACVYVRAVRAVCAVCARGLSSYVLAYGCLT